MSPSQLMEPSRSKPLPEPQLPASRAGRGTRAVLYGAMALLLATGAWLRYADRLGGLPGDLLAWAGGPAASPAASRASALVELALVPQAGEAAAVDSLLLPPGEAQTLRQALARRRMRLVQLPLYQRDGGSGALVRVECGGFTRLVRLGPAPVALTLPIAQAGDVGLRLVGRAAAAPVALGALTAAGPVDLPSFGSGQTLEIGVIAQ